ncbi:hypothetical protein [Tenacibaculum piscium]|uniref:hypothetical protein n=1 Tax=Tenacibaculum piscium TaxID=1458515 RepID=UPI0023BA3CF2|nr:hypothetical protein [Tenacibaculum piscium]
MKEVLKYIGIGFLTIGLLIGLSYAFGWVGVHQIKTISKAKQNANREVFEETNSFTKAKRQEIFKYYKEWNEVETLEEKKAIETILMMSLADFNEDKYITDIKLLNWVKSVKY